MSNSTEPNRYSLGDSVRCSVIFKNELGEEADPSTVIFRVRDPHGDFSDFTFGVNDELVRTAPGRYYSLVDALRHNTYTYRYEGTGDVKAACEKTFVVEKSAFP